MYSVFVRKETDMIEEEDPEDENKMRCGKRPAIDSSRTCKNWPGQVVSGKLQQEEKVHKKIGRLCERHKSVS